MHFQSATDEFLHFCTVERQLAANTIEAYAVDLQDFRKWLPPEVPLTDVSESTLKKYLTEMVGRRKLAPATIRRRFACLRAFFRRLADHGHLVSPFATWRLQLPRRKRLPRTLSRAEISSLLLTLKGTGAKPRRDQENNVYAIAIRLMVATGIRVGELCKLRIEDISPDASAFRIQGKGSRDRIAYIADTSLQHEIRRYLKRRSANNSLGPLFVNRCGNQVRPQSIRSQLRGHGIEIGLSRRITPHMLRHTAATLLIETGVDIRFVQRLLGHSSIATTEIYTHVSDEALRSTLKRADVLGTLAQL